MPVSIGEIVDKITILEIKQIHISDPVKIANVSRELGLLNDRIQHIDIDKAVLDQLRKVNQKLWIIEDAIRVCEHNADFGTNFIELARSVYITNDLRAELKKQINILTGSELIEEKSYA